MKQNIFLSVFIITLFSLVSCDDTELDVPKIDVAVNVENALMIEGNNIPVFSKGSSVKFEFDSDADILTFYSGEPGSMYEHKDRVSIDGVPYMQFDVQLEGAGMPSGYLNVLTSSDFKGFTLDADIDAENIKNATWNDVTDNSNIPTDPNTTNTSPRIDLSEYAGKPLYVAFRFSRPANKDDWPRYQIKNFSINNEADGFSYPIINTGNAGWTCFDFKAPVGFDPYLSTGGDINNRIWDIRNAATDSRIYIGYTSNIDNDDWVITTAIDLTSVTPDLGTGIKAYGDDLITEYQHVFNKTGTFKVSFIATNSRYSDKKVTVKDVMIKIID